jgi:pseudaminic acid cytidylyltransferase
MNDYFCVVPARGGSKRIPRKNLQEVAGVPLIGHVIQNAIASKVFKEVYVSTDSKEIASIASHFGAKVPELREPHLSDDATPIRPVIEAFITSRPDLQKENVVVACIFPLAIMASAGLLQAAKERFESLPSDNNKYLLAIQKYSHPVQRGFSMSSEGYLIPLDKSSLESRTQDLPVIFHDSGQFYFAKASTWLINRSMIANAYGIEIPKYLSIDVDDAEDLEMLRLIYQASLLKSQAEILE